MSGSSLMLCASRQKLGHKLPSIQVIKLVKLVWHDGHV